MPHPLVHSITGGYFVWLQAKLSREGAVTSRRTVLGIAASIAGAGVLGGCGEKSTRGGATQQLDKLSSLIPETKEPALSIPPPDVVGTRPVADGYTRFPPALVDAISEKPGRGGAAIRAITPVWGPAPPG